MPVITIAREYGAGGSEVAGLLAKELGADVVDKSLIAEVARRALLPAAEVAADDEQGRTLLERIGRAFGPVGGVVSGWMADPADLLDHHHLIIAATRTALREAAHSGNAVIIGRGAAAELRDEPGAFHVFLWAPEPDRVRAIRERLGCDETTALRKMHAVDASRATYVREAHGVDWRNRALYDLVINSARLGRAGAANAILGAIMGNRSREQSRTATADLL
jgi:cytidylate kinase